VSALLETPATATRTIPSLVGAGDKELATRTLHGSPEREILQHHHRERCQQRTAHPIELGTSVLAKPNRESRGSDESLDNDW
jgi:hypothetical protein